MVSVFIEQKAVISKQKTMKLELKKIELEVNQEKIDYINYADNEEMKN